MMLFFSLINMMYLLSTYPFLANFANRSEFFNEFTVMIICELSTGCVDPSVDLDFKYQMGWWIIYLSVFNITLNITIVAFSSLIDLCKNIKVYMERVAKNKRRKRKLENWDLLVKQFPEKFEDIKLAKDED